MHEADLTKPELHTALRWFFIAQTPYKVVVCLNKVSILLLYKRIFVSKAFHVATWVVMAVVLAWSLGAIFATLFQCVPIAGSWNKSVHAKCIDTDQFWVAYAVCNILTDVMVLSLPIPEVFKLNLRSLRERLMLCGVFLLGGFVVICGIVRTTSVANSLQNKTDTTWNFIPRGVWTLVEANVGIICACLPILKTPFNRGFSRVFGSRSASDNRGQYYDKGYQLKDSAGASSRQSKRLSGMEHWRTEGGDEEHNMERAPERGSERVHGSPDRGLDATKGVDGIA